MKTIFLLFTTITCFSSFAQDPQLFENDWYLYEVLRDDESVLYEVSQINPPISPYLVISENLVFTGNGACNSFSGTYSFSSPNLLTTIGYTATINDCDFQEHNLFEDHYFGFISGEFWYDITQDGGGAVLTMENAFFGHAIFKSYPLSTSGFYVNKFTIYPNPVNEELNLKNLGNSGNLGIKIYDLTGKLLILTFSETDTTINVSNLKQGVYFIVVKNSQGEIQTEKFLKI